MIGKSQGEAPKGPSSRPGVSGPNKKTYTVTEGSCMYMGKRYETGSELTADEGTARNLIEQYDVKLTMKEENK